MVHGVAKSQTGLSDFTFLSFVFLGKNPFPIDRNVITEVALNTGFRSRFVCSMYNNPNVGVLRFVAEKRFIYEAAEQVSDPPPSRKGVRVVRLVRRWLEERKVR